MYFTHLLSFYNDIVHKVMRKMVERKMSFRTYLDKCFKGGYINSLQSIIIFIHYFYFDTDFYQ